jgi:hypothetical protein
MLQIWNPGQFLNFNGLTRLISSLWPFLALPWLMIYRPRKNDSITDLTTLRDALRAFCAARDWHRFHTPKNLVMALSVEAAELVEHFQWATPEESLAWRRRSAPRSPTKSPTC